MSRLLSRLLHGFFFFLFPRVESNWASGLAVANVEEGVRLTWQVNYVYGVQDFRVFRSVNGSDFAFLAHVSPPSTPGKVSFTDPMQNLSYGDKAIYRVDVVVLGGEVRAVGGLVEIEFGPPGALTYVLHQNVPNPFNPVTTITFRLAEPGRTTLKIYDIAGRLVTTVVDDELPQGTHVRQWKGHDNSGASVASGIYFYQLIGGRFKDTKRMVVVR